MSQFPNTSGQSLWVNQTQEHQGHLDLVAWVLKGERNHPEYWASEDGKLWCKLLGLSVKATQKLAGRKKIQRLVDDYCVEAKE